MTTLEFSNEFDILLDSYRRFKSLDDKEYLDSIEFNEYEKSLFLTEALEELVVELYRNNSSSEGFELTEELRRYLSSLIKTSIIEETSTDLIKISNNSKFFTLPEDVLFITYESIILEVPEECIGESKIRVYPITLDELDKIKYNPFKGLSRNRVLRLDNNGNIVELLSTHPSYKYLIRYLSKPSPIILTDLSIKDLSINGIDSISECELNPILHRIILDRAVKKALYSKISFNNKE